MKLFFPKCAIIVESKEHVFGGCSVTRETWQQLQCVWPSLEESTSFMDWITCFLKIISLVSVDFLHMRYGCYGKKGISRYMKRERNSG